MLTYPDIDPILIHFTETTGVRWYGLMYVVGFLSFLFLGKIRARRPNSPVKPEQIDDMMFYGAIGVIAGGRIGEMFFYQFPQLMADPLKLFRLWEPGMSFHGGLIGVSITMLLLARKWKLTPLKLGDFIAPLVPIGLGAGRLGNFINGELWGRPTDVPWGMVFGHVDDLPRHPSQLYEAFLEGLVVFSLIYLFRKRKKFEGHLITMYLFLYALARFSAEFYRAPDVQIGYVCCGWMTKGQEFSLFMMLFSIMLYFILQKIPQKKVNYSS